MALTYLTKQKFILRAYINTEEEKNRWLPNFRCNPMVSIACRIFSAKQHQFRNNKNFTVKFFGVLFLDFQVTLATKFVLRPPEVCSECSAIFSTESDVGNSMPLASQQPGLDILTFSLPCVSTVLYRTCNLQHFH